MNVDDDLDGQIARLEEQLAAKRREKADRTDAAFLLVLARVVPAGVVFSAAEVLAHAALDRELAAAIGPMTARALGHYLRSLARRSGAGIVLQRCDDRNNRGCIWSIAITP